MRALIVLAFGLFATACTATTLETPHGSPADPTMQSQAVPQPSNVLDDEFDPLEAYANEAPSDAHAAHHMHHGAAPAAAPAPTDAADASSAGPMPNHSVMPNMPGAK